MVERESWWGTYEVEQGSALRWTLAPLTLEVYRASGEWQLAYGWDDELPDAPDWQVETQPGGLSVGEDEAERHILEKPGEGLRLLPLLADRPMVTSPRMPLYLAPAQEVTLYVGSPLWLRIEIRDPSHTLTEMPIRRPSDTWFGASTLEGELCYASKTAASLDVSNVPRLWRRAITPVLICNEAPEPLQIESLKLPVPLLSIYQTSEGQLWTDGVTMTRTADSELARLEIGSKRPSEARRAKLLTEARETAQSGLLTRTFSGIFRL